MADDKALDVETGKMLPVTVESHVPTTVVGPITALQYVKLANALFDSGLYTHLNNQGGVLAVLLDGVEKGIGMMTALQNMVVINKKLAYSAHLVMALAKQRAGVTWKVLENNTKGCKMQFSRPGFDPLIVSFTEADAQAAGLIRPNSGYTKYPADMYFARCGVKGCRRIAPDATCNLYSIEELSEGQYTTVDEVPAGGVVEVEGFGNQPRSTPKQPAPQRQPKGKTAASSDDSGFRMPFGKHKDELITEIPIPYLQWCLDKMDNLHDETREIIEHEVERRDNGNGKSDEDETSEPKQKIDPIRKDVIETIMRLEAQIGTADKGFRIDKARTDSVGEVSLDSATDDALVQYMESLQKKLAK